MKLIVCLFFSAAMGCVSKEPSQSANSNIALTKMSEAQKQSYLTGLSIEPTEQEIEVAKKSCGPKAVDLCVKVISYYSSILRDPPKNEISDLFFKKTCAFDNVDCFENDKVFSTAKNKALTQKQPEAFVESKHHIVNGKTQTQSFKIIWYK